ncbi:MAG: hypothetical protein ABSG65_08845 [Bryobacteraceae bacterium]
MTSSTAERAAANRSLAATKACVARASAKQLSTSSGTLKSATADLEVKRNIEGREDLWN